ncbi:MAG: Uncharacterised protein [Cryomorphaceae bacterium]|nr:MAG: Uncharacterised protein [Cryomorphaceae bacterium]
MLSSAPTGKNTLRSVKPVACTLQTESTTTAATASQGIARCPVHPANRSGYNDSTLATAKPNMNTDRYFSVLCLGSSTTKSSAREPKASSTIAAKMPRGDQRNT